MIIFATQCPLCGDVIWSRARHDFRWCGCQSVFVDGGQVGHSCRVGWNPGAEAIKHLRIEIDVTHDVAYADWNMGTDKFGLIPSGTSFKMVLEEVPDEVRAMNKTYRKPGGAIVPIVYREAAEMISDGDTILDYGSGKVDRWSEWHGYNLIPTENVYLYDIGDNAGGAIVGCEANYLPHYDVILVSNVLNVQPTIEHAMKIIRHVRCLLSPAGFAVMNMPQDPRKGEWAHLKYKEALYLVTEALLEQCKTVEVIERGVFYVTR